MSAPSETWSTFPAGQFGAAFPKIHHFHGATSLRVQLAHRRPSMRCSTLPIARRIATRPVQKEKARPNLTELSILQLLLLGRSHLCDQTLKRLKRLLGKISIKLVKLF